MSGEAPEETALYRVYGDEDLLLYIGISNDFGRRWKQHAKLQPWWPAKRRLTVDKWYPSRTEAEVAEEAAIKAEGPKHNVTHNVTHNIRPAIARTPNRYDEWLGMRIREQRQARHMSQTELAAKMTRGGHSWYQATIYRIKSARQQATFAEAMTLSEIFGFPNIDAFAMPEVLEGAA